MGDKDFKQIRRAGLTSIFLYYDSEVLMGHLTYKTYSSQPDTHVVFIELYDTAGGNKFELAHLVREVERRADAKQIAEVYVRPRPEERELFVALQYRVADYALLYASGVAWPSLEEHEQRPVFLKRLDRWLTTRIPPIQLPDYEPEELEGDALRLHKRLDVLRSKFEDIEEILEWWIEDRRVVATK